MKCNFDKLWRFLNKDLEPAGRAEVISHMEKCEICREAVYNLARDRAAEYFLHYELKSRLAS
jgi:hypothetical protein